MDMPMTDKVPDNAAKHVLKKAVRGLIPDAIIDRKKMGFGAPMSDWMRGPFGGEVETTLLSSRLFHVLPFDTAHIRWLIAEHRAARRDHALFLWTLFNLAAWYDYWIDRPLAVRAA
jgi:asparagine synthase (glutamine-hydrolysing)